VFIYFPVKKLAQTLDKSELTIKNALAALEQEKLILRVHQGVGQPNRIYVMCRRDRKLSAAQTENCLPDGQKTVPHADRILSTSNNKIVKTRKQEQYYYSYALPTYECSEDESL
jgi:predicted ArsR family transcriptional regulator